MTKNVSFIVKAKRTPIGNYGGVLSSVRPDDLLAMTLKGLELEKMIDLKLIEDVIIGCANQAGEDNRNVARMGLLLAHWPETTSGTTLNRLCGSSLDALIDAHARVVSGINDCVIAGGVESMSRSPFVISKSTSNFDRGQKMWDTTLGWRFPNSQMEKMFPLLGMGETAEEVQLKTGISRAEQDQWAYDSHMKALKAQGNGQFDSEIIAVEIKEKKEVRLITKDEGPRADCTLEKLATLKPAFRPQGTVTAGNSSSLNDGACALMVVSEKFLKDHPNITPLAVIKGGATAGLHPNIMGLGPVEASKKCIQKVGWTWNDIDHLELNEAFAVQVLGCLKEFQIERSKVNPYGGSIALGHPLGCSGGRIVTTMIHGFKNSSKKSKGLATMCIGVGQGIALALEKY